MPGFFAADVEESARSLRSLALLCHAQEPSAEDLYLMLGYSLSVPPYVRQTLFSRSIDNDDLLPRLGKPVLLVHGGKDAVVKLSAVDQHAARLAHSRVAMMPHAGHAAFWDDAATFNRHMEAFCEGLEERAPIALNLAVDGRVAASAAHLSAGTALLLGAFPDIRSLVSPLL